MTSGTLAVLLRALCFATLHRINVALSTGVGDDPGIQAWPQAGYGPTAKGLRQRQWFGDVAAQAEFQGARQHAMLDGWDEVARIASPLPKAPANNPEVESIAGRPSEQAPAALASEPANNPQVEPIAGFHDGPYEQAPAAPARARANNPQAPAAPARARANNPQAPAAPARPRANNPQARAARARARANNPQVEPIAELYDGPYEQAPAAPARARANNPQAPAAPARARAKNPQAPAAPARARANNPQARAARARARANNPQAPAGPGRARANNPQAPAAPARAHANNPEAGRSGGKAPAAPARAHASNPEAPSGPAAPSPTPAKGPARTQAASERRTRRLPRANDEADAIPIMPNLLCPPELFTADDNEEYVAPRTGSVPVIMQRGGKYGHNSATQRRFLQKMEPEILRSVREGAVVLDLGCADGINSMHMLRSIKNQAFNFTMAFVDLPGNDWSTVRRTVSSEVMDVYPKEGGAGKPDIMDTVPEMFGSKIALIGESFFNQVAADNTVNVAFSSTALHYLSIENIGGDRSRQAAEDWEAFLRARSRELVAGGRLHITALASNQQGVNPGAVWDVMQKVLSEAVLSGIISVGQRMSWQWPAYARTEDEWRAPFDQGIFPRLKMERFDIVLADTPYWAQAKGNACVFSSLYVPSVMAWIEPHLRRTFPRPLIDLFRRRLKASVEINPERFKPDLFQGMMIIRKTGGSVYAMKGQSARRFPREPANKTVGF